MVVPADAQPSPSYEELAGLLAVLAGRVDGLAAENAGLRAGFTLPLPPSSGAVAFELREHPGEVALVDEAADQSNVR